MLHKLLKCDPAKFVYIVSNLYRAEAKDPQDITLHEWQMFLKHMGATDEEIRDVQMRMGRPSASPAESQSPSNIKAKMTATHWLVTCSCGWERECSSEWAAAVSKQTPSAARPMDAAHVTRVEGPDTGAGERQLTLT